MQISAAAAAAVQAGRQTQGCAAEGEKQEGERLWLRRETVHAHFLMARMETRLEVIGRP